MHCDFRCREINGESYQMILWKYFRNGLAHGFAIKKGGFCHQSSYFSLKNISGSDCLMIDPRCFYEDFTEGVERFLSDLKQMAASWRPQFFQTFDDVYVQGR